MPARLSWRQTRTVHDHTALTALHSSCGTLSAIDTLLPPRKSWTKAIKTYRQNFCMVLPSYSTATQFPDQLLDQLSINPEQGHANIQKSNFDQSSSSSKPATYSPSGSGRGTTDSGPASPIGFDHGGAGRGRSDSGDTGSQSGSLYGGRGVYRGGHRGAGSHGGDDGRRSSGPFAGGSWRG